MPSKKNDDELIGFRDFMEKEDIKRPYSPKQNRGGTGGFELLTFFEREIKRVSKLLTLLQDKSHQLKEHDQSKKILQQIEKETKEEFENLSAVLLKDNSKFKSNIDELLQSHFNS